MHLVYKITWRAVVYSAILLGIGLFAILYWSYGHKKYIPSNVTSNIEEVMENVSPRTRVFIKDAQVEFLSFSDGLGLTLNDTYIQFGNNIIAAVPKIEIKLKLYDLLRFRIKFREITMEKPRFVISGDMDSSEFADSASRDFFNIYKDAIYGMFEKVDKNTNAIPVEKVDLNEAEFSFNNKGNYETWNIDKASLRFYSLQHTTYLSTYVKTRLFNRKSEITINARVLEDDKMMMKIDYSNISSKLPANFVKGMEWFTELKPVLDGTSTVVMDKQGISTTVSLDTNIRFRKAEIKDTQIGFKGVLDLIQDKEKLIKPKVHADVMLKDIDMKKLPIIWPEKYGGRVRSDVLSNYTKGTFNNVSIGFDYEFSDQAFTNIDKEKFSISGNIVDTDVIYSPDFPAVEKADGRFFYDGDNVEVDLQKGKMGNLDFMPTKIRINGLNEEKTVLEVDGSANGELSSLKPLLTAILKGRDKEFFYNTHDMSAGSEIKFYYKDNINNGFDPEVLKMDITAKLTNVNIKDVVKDVNLNSKNLEMKVDNNGLTLMGDATLNESPSQINVFVGFVKENDISLNVVSEAQTEVIESLLPGVKGYAEGILELEFQYQSEGSKNFFVGKIDSIDSTLNFPQLGWKKPKGVFASISLGGRYIAGKALDINELQIVSSDSVSVGRMIIALDDSVADELYFNRLTLGGNDAEVFFNITKRKIDKSRLAKAYLIKIKGESFNASQLLSSFKNIASSDNSMIFNMDVKNLTMANGVMISNVSGLLQCSTEKCHDANFTGSINGGGKVSFLMKAATSAGDKGPVTFEMRTDNAGAVINSFDISSNVEGGIMTIDGDVDGTAQDQTNGNMLIQDFKLKKAPVITKVLSLASFTGLLDLLSGSGVPMKKLKGNFQMKDDYLALSSVKAHGDSLGFTLQGNIHLDDFDTDLSGAVTPSYGVNSALGKVPIIGALFKGKEGEGLIATNYRIKGKYPNVDVSVNPLSALTPGFLRNIWGDAETDIDKKKSKKSKTESNIKQKGFPVNVKPSTANP